MREHFLPFTKCSENFNTMPKAFLWKHTLFRHCWRKTEVPFLKQPPILPILYHKSAATCQIDLSKVSKSNFFPIHGKLRLNLNTLILYRSWCKKTQGHLAYTKNGTYNFQIQFQSKENYWGHEKKRLIRSKIKGEKWTCSSTPNSNHAMCLTLML